MELVALAAEIAAVAGHAQGRFLPQGYSPGADKVRVQCLFFLRAADQVLSRGARTDSLTTGELAKKVASFRSLQAQLVTLREASGIPNDTLLG